jgi:hypothetical protein
MTGISNAEEINDSEELQRQVEVLTIQPKEKVLTHSVRDSLMVTCIGNDLKWRSPNLSYVESYDQRERIHVEDFSDPSTDNQTLSLIFREINEMDHGDWTCEGIYEEKSFTLFVYGKFVY